MERKGIPVQNILSVLRGTVLGRHGFRERGTCAYDRLWKSTREVGTVSFRLEHQVFSPRNILPSYILGVFSLLSFLLISAAPWWQWGRCCSRVFQLELKLERLAQSATCGPSWPALPARNTAKEASFTCRMHLHVRRPGRRDSCNI